MKKNNILSHWSLFSLGSTGSVFTLICFVSILSAGSLTSILSVGSVASLASIASYASVLSFASDGCVMGFMDNCFKHKRNHIIQTRFKIDIDADTWDLMTTCSKEEYKSADRPDKCDYRDAICSFTNLTSGYNVTSSCEVRRKGSATWRDLDMKPSFKIKKFGDDIEWGTFECEYCPPGEDTNEWKTNKKKDVRKTKIKIRQPSSTGNLRQTLPRTPSLLGYQDTTSIAGLRESQRFPSSADPKGVTRRVRSCW